MYSAFFKLNKRDIVNGIVVAVIAAVGSTLSQAAQGGTLDIFVYDWWSILKLSLNVAIAYLVKNLLTSENGKVLGKI